MLNQSDLSWYGQTTKKNDFFNSQARALENQNIFFRMVIQAIRIY